MLNFLVLNDQVNQRGNQNAATQPEKNTQCSHVLSPLSKKVATRKARMVKTAPPMKTQFAMCTVAMNFPKTRPTKVNLLTSNRYLDTFSLCLGVKATGKVYPYMGGRSRKMRRVTDDMFILS